MPEVPYTPDPELDAQFRANPPTRQPPAEGSQSGQVDMVTKHAQRVGLDPVWLRKIIRTESGGDPNQVTGSYKGLGQLSLAEFRKHGGTGSIFDPEQNVMALANKISAEKTRFEQKFGRPATLSDIYGIHNQGEAGYATHLANPDKPAWQNMQTASGRSAEWAHKAIWWNMTPSQQSKYGPPGKDNWKYAENVKSGDFTQGLSSMVEGKGGGPISGAVARSKARREGIPEDAGEPTQKKPQAVDDTITSVPDTTRIVQANVEAPSFSFGRPLVAPQLPRAGRVPQ